jgi:hypothetical protein
MHFFAMDRRLVPHPDRDLAQSLQRRVADRAPDLVELAAEFREHAVMQRRAVEARAHEHAEPVQRELGGGGGRRAGRILRGVARTTGGRVPGREQRQQTEDRHDRQERRWARCWHGAVILGERQPDSNPWPRRSLRALRRPRP